MGLTLRPQLSKFLGFFLENERAGLVAFCHLHKAPKCEKWEVKFFIGTYHSTRHMLPSGLVSLT